MMTKQKRIDIVNQLIVEISSRSRAFFKHSGKIASFELKWNRIYYIREWAAPGQKDKFGLSVPEHKRLSGLHSGGTIKALINEFYDFVMTGKDCDGNSGRGGLYCTFWGYPEEDMKSIREKAFELGYLQTKPSR